MNIALNPAPLKICIALMIVLVVIGGIPARAMNYVGSPLQNPVNAREDSSREPIMVAMGIDRIPPDQEDTTGTLPPAGISGLSSLSASFGKMVIPLNSGNGPSAGTSVRLLVRALNGDDRAGPLSPPQNIC